MKKEQLLHTYLNLPIRFKILLWFIPLLLVTIAFTGWYSFYTAKNQVLEKVTIAQQEYANQVSDQLDYISRDAVDFTNYLFLLSSVQQFLNPITQEDSLARRKQINEIVSSLLVNQRDMQSLVLYGFNDQVPPLAVNQSGITSTMPFQKFKQTNHYQLAVQQKGRPSWTLLKGDEQLFEGDNRTKIMLTRVIKNSYTLNDLGIVVVGINEETLRKKYTEGLSNNAQMFIVNNNKQIITSTDEQWIGKDVFETPFFKNNKENQISPINKEWLLSSSKQSAFGWEILLIQPRDELLEELGTIKVWTFLVTAFCFVVGVWISWYVSSIITKPLKKLTKSMYLVQRGDFNQRVEFRGNDEVGALGRGYDMMVQRIKRLIDDVYMSQLRQKEAELKSLQAQIHPHFLYNTLDTIFWKAQQRKETEIADMIYSLSQFFRLSLSDGKEFVTIGNELLLVENYLALQKTRFVNKFSYEIQINEELKNILVPKLLIQPLVENSIIHGLNLVDDNGFIYIHISKEKEYLLLEVMDNGAGIESSRLQQLNAYLQATATNQPIRPEEQRPGYALMNISERLKLKYDAQATMMIESTQGVGTKIKIKVPITYI
ncbi:sensor histidine kinase [Radiobacillus sp. PE A8.2]|uniref:cache domain-containing sensor histidine kinase n=1 Tax=Radiobacillus sp. PE A8.2 TaxID=3380349 RepID=UPI00388D636A